MLHQWRHSSIIQAYNTSLRHPRGRIELKPDITKASNRYRTRTQEARRAPGRCPRAGPAGRQRALRRPTRGAPRRTGGAPWPSAEPAASRSVPTPPPSSPAEAARTPPRPRSSCPASPPLAPRRPETLDRDRKRSRGFCKEERRREEVVAAVVVDGGRRPPLFYLSLRGGEGGGQGPEIFPLSHFGLLLLLVPLDLPRLI